MVIPNLALFIAFTMQWQESQKLIREYRLQPVAGSVQRRRLVESALGSANHPFEMWYLDRCANARAGGRFSN